jgi:glycosyltransferase involved in cell wall biosynthesis
VPAGIYINVARFNRPSARRISRPTSLNDAVKTPMSKVSVIIPTYNCARYIGEAIESVSRQTRQATEIVVVDDGSTDDTETVLGPYIDRRIVRYARQANQGPGAARNSGIALATGDYIAFLDADDALTPDSLEKRVGLIEAVPEMNFAFSDYFYQDDPARAGVALLRQQRFLEKFAAIAMATSNGTVFSSASFDDVFEIPFFVTTNTVVVRRRAFEKAGVFRTDILGHEDTDMWLRLAKNSPIGYIDAPLAYYKRFRGNLTMRNPLRYGEDRIRFLELLRKENAGLEKARAIISQRLGWVHYDIACHFSRQKQLLRARQYFVKSILSDPRSRLSYRALASSFVPASWKKWARGNQHDG